MKNIIATSVVVLTVIVLGVTLTVGQEPKPKDKPSLDDAFKGLDYATKGPFGGTTSLMNAKTQLEFQKNPTSFKKRRLVIDYLHLGDNEEELPSKATFYIGGTGDPKSMSKLVVDSSPDGLLPPFKGQALPKFDRNNRRAYLVFDCTEGDLEKGNQSVAIIPVKSPVTTDFVDNTKEYKNTIIYFTSDLVYYDGEGALRKAFLAPFRFNKPRAEFLVQLKPEFAFAKFKSTDDLPNASRLDRLNIEFYCEKGDLNDGNFAIEIRR